MRTLWNPPPGSQVSGSHSAVRYCALRSGTVLRSKGLLRRTQIRAPYSLRAVPLIDKSRRAAPPGTRSQISFFVLQKTRTRL